MARPISSATAGTTASPRAETRSIRSGIPLATRRIPASESHRSLPASSCRPAASTDSAIPRPDRRRLAGWATRSSRRRMCGAPTEHAETSDHSASNPRSERSPRIHPNASASLSSPRTFSTRMLGQVPPLASRTASTAAMNQGHPQRSSPTPSPSPEWLNGWQGNPPATSRIRRTGWLAHHRGKVRTSSCCATSGQRRRSTRRRNGSFSTCARQLSPARSSPRSRPPMPENSET